MTETLPDPLLSDEVDLRDFPFMPLDVVRLRDSDLAARSTAEEFRAAVFLWCASWHQIPAASLPDDDNVLARLAGFGRGVKDWMKHRKGALRGWMKCSDGRLYHPVVSEKANEAWGKREGMSRRGKAGARARWKEKQSVSNSVSIGTSIPIGTAKANGEADASAMPEAMPKNGNRQGQGQGQGDSSVLEDENGRRPPPPSAGIPKPPDPDADLFNRGKSILGKTAGGQIAKLKAMFGGDVARTRAYLEDAAVKSDPGEYVAATIRKHAGKPPPASGGLDFQRFPANGLYDTSI